MGGSGSGRWGGSNPDAKTLVEDCRRLDLRLLVREGAVRPGAMTTGRWTWSRGGKEVASVGYEAQAAEDHGTLRLVYTVTRGEAKTDVDYRVALETTLLPSGGRRWWFRCLARRGGGPPCGRRAATLYLPPGATYFACRSCHRLAYTSSRESRRWDRMFRQLASSTGFPVEEVRRVMMRGAR